MAAFQAAERLARHLAVPHVLATQARALLLHTLVRLGDITSAEDILAELSEQDRELGGVRSRLRTEFGNGEAFYAKEGTVITLPDRRRDQPNADFLQWHMDMKFKAS